MYPVHSYVHSYNHSNIKINVSNFIGHCGKDHCSSVVVGLMEGDMYTIRSSDTLKKHVNIT